GRLYDRLCRQRRKNLFRLDRHNIFGGDLHRASGHLQAVLVSNKLVACYLQALTAAQHHVFCSQRGRCQHDKREQKCGTSRNTSRDAKGALQTQGAASRNANCSIAKATPFSSFVPVSCQPYVFNAATLFPITTGMPANESISRSLWLSPMAITSSRVNPRSAAHSASDDPFEHCGLITSIIAKS